MLGKGLLIALLGVCCASVFDNSLKFSPFKGIQRFEIDIPKQAKKVDGRQGDEFQKQRNAILLKGAPVIPPGSLLPLFGLQAPSNQAGSGRKSVTLHSYEIKNCSAHSAEEAVFVIRQLEIKPDPVVLPGSLNFTFNLNLMQTFNALQVVLDLRKKVGDTYITIPCIGEFGSCTYDVCELLSQVENCPEELVEHNIDCKCPLKKDIYDVPGILANIGVSVFPSGDYKVTAHLNSAGVFAACYTAVFSIA